MRWLICRWFTSSIGNVMTRVNIKEDNKSYWFEVAAPGMKKSDFKVMLTLKFTVS
jgi:HSP20 family molecular chaperone IbpA